MPDVPLGETLPLAPPLAPVPPLPETVPVDVLPEDPVAPVPAPPLEAPVPDAPLDAPEAPALVPVAVVEPEGFDPPCVEEPQPPMPAKTTMLQRTVGAHAVRADEGKANFIQASVSASRLEQAA